jgi:cytochrome P450
MAPMVPLPPGPTGPSLLRLARWIWSPIGLLEECEARFGNGFTVRLPGMPPNVVFSDPDAVKDLFTAAPDDVRLGEISKLLKPVMGENSVMLLDGARHLRERKLIQQPLHGERMRAYGELMRRAAREAVARWPITEPFSMLEEMHAVTLEIILNAIIGVRSIADLAPMRDSVTTFLKLGTSPLATALLLATPQEHFDALVYETLDALEGVGLGKVVPWRSLVLAQRRMDCMLHDEFAARRREADLGARQDVLSLLMSVRDDKGQAMTDQELRDEIVTLLLAGHETTATTLAWSIVHLLRSPRTLERLRSGLESLDPEAIDKDEYLDAVLRETMRLSPVALVVGRRLMAPMRLGRWDLPAGVNALACLYLTQRRADLWDRPREFLPERWIGAKIDPYQFFPFGGGTRRCLGMAFAYYEMKMVLAEVVKGAHLRFADDKPIEIQRKSITFAPSRGLPVVVTSRRAASGGATPKSERPGSGASACPVLR